jgi:catechol 2,3-dioxygenase-like lactoylglutathione lyase family enzyme
MKYLVILLSSMSLSMYVHAQTRPPITGISHIAIYASDPDAAEHYYVHDIGLLKGADPENRRGVRYYVNPTQFVEILPLPSEDLLGRLDHLAYITTAAEQLRIYLAAHKVTVPAGVEHGSDGSIWFHVKDPEGNVVEFVQPSANPIGTRGAHPIGEHIIHVGMRVQNRDEEDPFYRDILGFRPYWYGGMVPEKVDWVSLQVPNGKDWLEYMLSSVSTLNGGLAAAIQRQLGILNHLSIGVVNVQEAVTTLKAEDRLNNEHVGPQIGRDGKWQYNLFDPDRTRLELMEFAPIEKPCCSPFTAPHPVAPSKLATAPRE